MDNFNIGDIVARKSYGGDIYFRIIDIVKHGDGTKSYALKGLLYRLEADSHGGDLVKQSPINIQGNTRRNILIAKRHAAKRSFPPAFRAFARFSSRAGKILHIDSDEEFMNTCLQHYREAGLQCAGKYIEVEKQPYYIRQLLEQYQPDILVVTGHDGLKKSNGDLYSIDNYRNSKYYVQSVKEARQYQPSLDSLCVFAGACQSYFEAIMDSGANFASSPGRVFINALDPAIVAERVALTSTSQFVTSSQLSQLTVSGSEGIGGINTRGHLARV